MHTQNVNVKTATRKTTERWGEQNPAMAFVCNGEVIQWAKQEGGEWVSLHGGYSLAQMKAGLPGVELVPEAEALEMQNARYRRPWQEITEARYIDQLEVLPPMDWNRSGAGESFKSMEMYAFDVTSIFAQVKGRFFECRDVCTLTHAEVMRSLEADFFAGDAVNSGH